MRYQIAILNMLYLLLAQLPIEALGAQRSYIQPVALSCEYLCHPLAISSSAPRLSWKLEATHGDWQVTPQSAYQIRAASSASLLRTGKSDLWDSGRVQSPQTLHVRYAGRRLTSGQSCFWQVRVWDEHGSASTWSHVAEWRTGLLEPSDWQGTWIGAVEDNSLPTANQNYRRTFVISDQCANGMVYVASLGFHEVYVNGHRLGDSVLTPAISDPLHRVRYVAYDATPYLRVGNNVLCVALGAGWTLYNGHGWTNEAIARWPRRPAIQVQGVFRDSTGDRIAEVHSDPKWRTCAADLQPLRRWQFQDFSGERQTSDNAASIWIQPDFSDANWPHAEERLGNLPTQLTPQEVEPNRLGPAVRANRVEEIAPDVYRVTMDRMFTGFLDVQLTGQPGAAVTIEISDRQDVPCVYGQEQKFSLNNEGRGAFRNRFNYANGQWITIRGDVDPPNLSQISAWMVSTDLERVGHFRCSDQLHNQIYETSLQTLECLNLGGYVVDCSHRERLGYGGDGQVTAMAMLPNYACGAFYSKWLLDWCDAQQEDGNLTFTAPTYGGGGGPAWSGFLVHISADLYERFADQQILQAVYPTISRWLAFLEQHTVGHQLERYDGPPPFVQHEWSFLGDWVYPGHDQTPNSDDASTHFLNNCYYVWTLRRATAIAEVLGKVVDAAKWRQRAKDVAAATHLKYWDAHEQRYTINRQANLAIALIAEITPKELAPRLEQQLEESLAATDYHLDTGIGGTLFLLRALQNTDRPDLVFRLASQRDYPSWGKMLDDGATAFWEQWDGNHSRCHSSYLGIGGWYVESIAGIQHDPAAPGYSHILFKPGIVEGLEWAEGSLNSPRGVIKSSWRRKRECVEIAVTIPPNTMGSLFIPIAFDGPADVRDAPTGTVRHALTVHSLDRQRILKLDAGSYRIYVTTKPLLPQERAKTTNDTAIDR
jgi:hypothetical protein